MTSKMRCVSATIYRQLYTAKRRVSIFLDSTFQGIWLGLLDSTCLDEVTLHQYRRYEVYRSDAHNISGLMEWEKRVAHDYFPDGGSVVVAAAGGGREVLALRQMGFAADGFDCADELVDCARTLLNRMGFNCRLALCDPGDTPSWTDKYDAIVVGWGGYMHIPGRRRRIEFLRKLRLLAKPGAPILLSFYHRGGKGLRFRYTRSIANAIRKVRFDGESLELGDRLSNTFDHYFTKDEVQSELISAGYTLEYFSTLGYGHAVGIENSDGSSGPK